MPPAVTGPVLGPAAPPGVGTGAGSVMPGRYAELAASEAGSSRGDEEETLLEVGEAKHSVPWYKDFQVAVHHFAVTAAAPQCYLSFRLICTAVFASEFC